jgi:hypothetical protein
VGDSSFLRSSKNGRVKNMAWCSHTSGDKSVMPTNKGTMELSRLLFALSLEKNPCEEMHKKIVTRAVIPLVKKTRMRTSEKLAPK